jgi:ubiquinol-cytochrome c reductase cytochrome b subunit
VFAALSNWLDHRTGYRKLVSALLLEEIPGGAKWRYVWGSCLAFVFAIQLVTGVLLMTSYSASDTNAWGSVYFIQYEMDFGWLIRGLHHFGSQTMVVLLALHVLQVVIAGAHLPPREVNWWLGLALLGCVLGLSLTGYLLPWDQKGYWATKVATNIAGSLPGIGATLSKIIVGGPEYGNHTLTRFYALHVGILPPLVIVLLIAHVVVFRRHGVTTWWPSWLDWPWRRLVGLVRRRAASVPSNGEREGWFWPDQAFRDMLASMAIFGVMLGLVMFGFGHALEPANESVQEVPAERSLWDRIAHAGRDGKGADLDAPADPGTESYPARPEWYFLFLFQLLKYFEGEQEIIGTVVVPNGVLILLALLPLLAFGRKQPGGMRALAHGFGVVVVVGLLGGAGFLTYQALAADRKNEGFQGERRKADVLAARAVQLAHEGIPAEGGRELLRHDPQTQGPRLFKDHCATCHSYEGLYEDTADRKAGNLAGFGTKQWIAGLLVDPSSPHYYGRTRFKGGRMTGFVAKARAGNDTNVSEEFDAVATWLATHPRGKRFEEDKDPALAKGYKVFEKRCARCHSYEGEGGGDEGSAPDLTGYGDADWLRLMIMSPDHSLRYGTRNRMTGFRDLEGPAAAATLDQINRFKNLLLKDLPDDEKAAERHKQDIEESMRVVHLGEIDRELIIRWLLHDDRVVFGGEPISAPPKQ